MNFNCSVILYLFLASTLLANTVSGTANLADSNNHSDILIEFLPISNTAEYASTLSDELGEYSILVKSGTYSIRYSKDNYQIFEIDELFVSSDIELDPVILSSKGFKEVSGILSGQWFRDTTYSVIGDITIPSGESLTIEPGTLVEFENFYDINVNGSLMSIGSRNDSIVFTSGKSTKERGDWEGVRFNFSNDTSFLKYTKLEYAGPAKFQDGGIIWIAGGKVVIENSSIAHSPSTGIYSQSGFLRIQDSKVFEIFEHGIRNKTTIDVRQNEFFNIDVVGLNNFSNSGEIYFNLFHGCGNGIVTFFNSIVENNIFYNNTVGIQVAQDKPVIRNNTFVLNDEGIEVYDARDGEPTVMHNIFKSNTKAIDNENNIVPDVSYNLFYDNGSFFKIAPTGFGEVITENPNGTGADTYFNIFENPLLYETSDPKWKGYLTQFSPAISAGESGETLGAYVYDNLGPSAFNLVSSSLKEFNYDAADIEFKWTRSIDSDSIAIPIAYSLAIYQDSEIVYEVSSIEDTVYAISDAFSLLQNESYHWSVTSTDDLESAFSDTLSFSMPNLAPSDFELLSPRSDSLLMTFEETTLVWDENLDTDVITYSILLQSEELDTLMTSSSSSIEIGSLLTANNTYEWYVFASDAKDTTYSDTLTFFTGNIPPSSFSLTSPRDESVVPLSTQVFEWQTSEDLEPIKYSLFIYDGDATVKYEEIESNSLSVDINSILVPDSSYQWFVLATDGIDTTYSDTLNFSIDAILSVSRNAQLRFYPNPAKDIIQVMDDSSPNLKTEIYSMDGKLVLSESKNVIDISSLNKGIYLILLSSENGAIELRSRFIKE